MRHRQPAASHSTYKEGTDEFPCSNFVTTKDGIQIFYKDWGTASRSCSPRLAAQSADDWDAQMLFFLGTGLPRDRP